jgi:folate-binding Fe-S cluster repair protein YgfZ
MIPHLGRDAFKFLQGITTNDLSLLQRHPSASIYSNILNVQGRVAFDVLISPPPDSQPTTSNTTPEHIYLLDCAKNSVEDIQKYFDRYILRNKVKITDISNSYRVWSVFGRAVAHSSLSSPIGKSALSLVPADGVPEQSLVTGELAEWWKTKRDGVLAMDPRLEELGARIVLPLSETRE